MSESGVIAEPRAALHVAAAQIPIVENDVIANLATARRAVAEAAGAGADFVLLPEMTLAGLLTPAQVERWDQTSSDEGVAGVRALAVEYSVGVSAGLPERDPDSGAVYITTLVFGRGGELLARYRKTHLYDVERERFAPGDTLGAPFDFEGLRCGVLCCFDIEYPEAARKLALAGAECLLVPSANMEPWGHTHRTAITARALENQVYVVYANRCGPGPDMTYVGESAVVDPFGHVRESAQKEPALVMAEVDPRQVHEARRHFTYLELRRPELYG